MEDKSAGGACIRVKTPIRVGAKLTIQWRFEQFSGTAKYCRGEGREYLVGIQRDSTTNPILTFPTNAALQKVVSNAPPATPIKVQALKQQEAKRPEEKSIGLPAVRRDAESAPILISPEPEPKLSPAIDRRDRLRLPRLPDIDARAIRHRTKLPLKESGKERKSMHHKWLELAPWRSKQEVVRVSAVENAEARTSSISSGHSEKENPMPHATPSTEKAPMASAREVPDFRVELLPMEDIYRAAGIMNPRKGYSITKVVEMLHSQHIRGLSQEMKRAAVLMALDAADISLDQLQHDAKARQDALDAHEADQRKQVEAEWARKAEEVIQIQAELESIKAHYTARISRNLDGVAKEKATFNAWLAMKQQETQKMSEAVDLCLKTPTPEPSAPVAEVGMAKAASAGASEAGTSDARAADATRD
jgi:hypothetical protein